MNATVCGQSGESRYSLGYCGMETGSAERKSWLGPLLLAGGWLGEGRGTQAELQQREHLTPKARAVGGKGITVHFPCRLGVGVRVSKTCTPTQEEMGLRLFDLKPPSWCLVQFPKMAAHLSGRGTGEEKKNTAQNICFGDQARDRGKTVVLFKSDSEKQELEEGPG